MAEFYLPVLSHFQNGNFWTASDRRMRYRVDPEGEELVTQVWEGPWEEADSEMEDHQRFPLSEEGLTAIQEWAAGWSETINSRPALTLAETIQRRDALRARRAEEAAGQEAE